jgi:hypothetical protein
MCETTLPRSIVWGSRVLGGLSAVVGLFSLGVGLYEHIWILTWMGLGFLVGSLAQFHFSFLSRERRFSFLVVQLALLAVAGAFCVIVATMSWRVLLDR